MKYISLFALLFALSSFAADPTPAAKDQGLGTKAPQTPNLELRAIDSLLETVRTVNSQTLDAIKSELTVLLPGIPIRKSGGRSTKNDYRNYQWLSVRIAANEYLITLNHNNLDFKTGNPHTQFGRVQFLKCAGPNGPHKKDDNGIWRYNSKAEWSKMPKICVWDEDYSSAKVAALFCEFLAESGESLKLEHPEPSKLQSPISHPLTPSPSHLLTNDNCTLHIAHCTLNSDLPLAERQKADIALSTFRTIVSAEMNRVYDLLHARHPDWAIRRSRGNSRKNDYRNYQWITITVGEEMYIIAFVYNDIDLSTGNMHSQFGRVAFWSDIHYENGRKNEAGPHTKDAGGWLFRYDKQWKDMPALYLWAPDYSTERVADLFEVFVESKKRGRFQ